MKYSASYVINLGTCLIWEHSVNIEELKSAKLKMDILKAGFVSPVRLQDIHPWGSMVGAQLRRKPANYTGRLSWNNVNKLLIEVNYHFHIYRVFLSSVTNKFGLRAIKMHQIKF